MSIPLAIATLQQYKTCKQTKLLATKYFFEIKRRLTYIDNLILQLNYAARSRHQQSALLIADDIRHCLLQNYYALLPFEKETDNFNFTHTLKDVIQLIEMDTADIAAA